MKTGLRQGTLDLSVVIPSLNEGPNLYRLIPLVRTTLDELGLSSEVLVIDGGSRDGTDKIVNDAGGLYIHEPRPGYGPAILRGIVEAKGGHILTMDADLSHPVEFLESMWKVRDQAEVIIASRYVPGGHAEQPWSRRVLSKTLNRFFAAGLSLPIKDLSSGFRLYRSSIFDRIDLAHTNFVILIEILLKAFSEGYQIKEIPFHFQQRGSGSSKARIIKFGIDYLRLFYRMWKIRNSVEFPDYDWRAHDSRIPLQRYWQRKRHEIIMRYTPPYVSTADVGCGSSHILADLPHALGIDMRHDKLKFMRKTNKVLVQANGMELPLREAAFDCVICSQVIEHIPEENGRLIDELDRILKPGGILILGTPDYDCWQWVAIEWLYGKVAPGAYADEHVTHYSLESLKSALAARGHEILEFAYILKGELIIKSRKTPT